MGVPEIILAVLGVVGGFLATAGYGAVSVTPADFKKSRFCFIGAGICLGGFAIVWVLTTVQPPWARIFVTGAIGAVALVGLTEGLRWLDMREDAVAPRADVSPSTVPAVPVSPSPKYRQKEVENLIDALQRLGPVLQHLLQATSELTDRANSFGTGPDLMSWLDGTPTDPVQRATWVERLLQTRHDLLDAFEVTLRDSQKSVADIFSPIPADIRQNFSIFTQSAEPSADLQAILQRYKTSTKFKTADISYRNVIVVHNEVLIQQLNQFRQHVTAATARIGPTISDLRKQLN